MGKPHHSASDPAFQARAVEPVQTSSPSQAPPARDPAINPRDRYRPAHPPTTAERDESQRL
jgi:hypothetical protein